MEKMNEKEKELYFTEKDLADRIKEIKEDVWGDLKIESQKILKDLLEKGMELEVRDMIGVDRYEHDNDNRKNYRNGFYYRSLLSSYGKIKDIRVPRVREGKVRFKVLDKYQRRSEDIDDMIRNMFLHGVSTRNVKEVLKVIIGEDSVSASTVSEIVKVLDRQVQLYHNRSISDDYIIIILDAVYVKSKDPIYKKNKCILVAFGIKEDGRKELIDFRIAKKGESQASWELFLSNLYARGLEGKKLKVVSMDGNKGVWNAIDLVWPQVKKQRCIAHKMRNVSNYVPKRFQQQCLSEAKQIYKAKDYEQAIFCFKKWSSNWSDIVPKAVKCFEKDLDSLLIYYQFPEELWKKIRTTNIIERAFREVRRRIRPISCFTNNKSVERIIYAIFSKLNNNWKNNPIKFTQKY